LSFGNVEGFIEAIKRIASRDNENKDVFWYAGEGLTALVQKYGGKDFAIMYANANRPDIVGEYISDDYKDANGKEFRKDMLNKLLEAIEIYGIQSKLSIDRINNDGNYSSENCQWIPIGFNSSKDSAGKPKSLQHRQAMSKERKGKPQTPARIAAIKLTHELLKKPVYKLDKSGNSLERYASIQDAAISCNIISQNISEICSGSNPNRHTAGGYRWIFA